MVEQKAFELLGIEDLDHLAEINQYPDRFHDLENCRICNPIFEIEVTEFEIKKIQEHLQEDMDDEIVKTPYVMDLCIYHKWRDYGYLEERETIKKYIEELERFEKYFEDLVILCPGCGSTKIAPECDIFGEWFCLDCDFKGMLKRNNQLNRGL